MQYIADYEKLHGVVYPLCFDKDVNEDVILDFPDESYYISILKRDFWMESLYPAFCSRVTSYCISHPTDSAKSIVDHLYG